MSCLLRASKRLKGSTTPDDLAGAQTSVRYVSEVGLVADTSERVWNRSDLSIFNGVQKPIGAVASSTNLCAPQMRQVEGLTACGIPEPGVSKTLWHPQVSVCLLHLGQIPGR